MPTSFLLEEVVVVVVVERAKDQNNVSQNFLNNFASLLSIDGCEKRNDF